MVIDPDTTKELNNLAAELIKFNKDRLMPVREAIDSKLSNLGNIDPEYNKKKEYFSSLNKDQLIDLLLATENVLMEKAQKEVIQIDTSQLEKKVPLFITMIQFNMLA